MQTLYYTIDGLAFESIKDFMQHDIDYTIHVKMYGKDGLTFNYEEAIVIQIVDKHGLEMFLDFCARSNYSVEIDKPGYWARTDGVFMQVAEPEDSVVWVLEAYIK